MSFPPGLILKIHLSKFTDLIFFFSVRSVAAVAVATHTQDSRSSLLSLTGVIRQWELQVSETQTSDCEVRRNSKWKEDKCEVSKRVLIIAIRRYIILLVISESHYYYNYNNKFYIDMHVN